MSRAFHPPFIKGPDTFLCFLQGLLEWPIITIMMIKIRMIPKMKIIISKLE